MPVVIAPLLPGSPQARSILTAYFRDIVSRYLGRQATRAEVAAAMRDDPSDDLAPPHGLLLAARDGDTVVGCAGVLFLPAGLGEVRRVFVRPAARGLGVGAQLLGAVEDAARDHYVTRLRLDTHGGFAEARRLYARQGYRETAPFSDGPFAEHWYEKALSRGSLRPDRPAPPPDTATHAHTPPNPGLSARSGT